jgi:hypothetical protein
MLIPDIFYDKVLDNDYVLFCNEVKIYTLINEVFFYNYNNRFLIYSNCLSNFIFIFSINC